MKDRILCMIGMHEYEEFDRFVVKDNYTNNVVQIIVVLKCRKCGKLKYVNIADLRFEGSKYRIEKYSEQSGSAGRCAIDEMI